MCSAYFLLPVYFVCVYFCMLIQDDGLNWNRNEKKTCAAHCFLEQLTFSWKDAPPRMNPPVSQRPCKSVWKCSFPQNERRNCKTRNHHGTANSTVLLFCCMCHHWILTDWKNYWAAHESLQHFGQNNLRSNAWTAGQLSSLPQRIPSVVIPRAFQTTRHVSVSARNTPETMGHCLRKTASTKFRLSDLTSQFAMIPHMHAFHQKELRSRHGEKIQNTNGVLVLQFWPSPKTPARGLWGVLHMRAGSHSRPGAQASANTTWPWRRCMGAWGVRQVVSVAWLVEVLLVWQKA